DLRRTEEARVVAALRVFDLDDFGAEIGKVQRAPRTCQHAGEVQDADAGERRQRRNVALFSHAKNALRSPESRDIEPNRDLDGSALRREDLLDAADATRTLWLRRRQEPQPIRSQRVPPRKS